jgi:hypothetical protein
LLRPLFSSFSNAQEQDILFPFLNASSMWARP